MQTFISPDAQILFRHKGRKQATASLFIVMTGIVASVIGMSFFICLSGFRLKFSRIALLRKRLQLDSKSDLTTNGLILEFFVGVRIFLLTPYLHVLKFAWIARMCCSFDDIKFFGWLVWGVFSSVLLFCPYFLVIGFCNLASWALAMHLYFPFYVRLSSSVYFTASTDELTINTSENHIVPRISFFKLAVCWCSTPFTASCVLRNIIWTILLHLLVVGPVGSWIVFLAGGNFTKLDLFEMHTCLWPAAQILLIHKWRNLATASLLLHYIDESSFLGCWNEFLPSVFQVLGWSFLVLHLYGNVCNWTPKLIWSQMDWFWGVFLNMAFFGWRIICMDWSLHELLNFVSLLTTSSLFDN